MDEINFSDEPISFSSFHEEELNIIEEVLEDITKPKSKRQARNYINNEDFCNALIEYKKVVEECEEKGIKPPPIPDYVGKCWMKIAEGMSRNTKFFRYPFKEEAISDSLLNCARYWRNFNPQKTRNAFAYFSQYVFNAFVRKINLEQKEQYIKYKSTESFLTLDESEMYEEGELSQSPHEIYENMNSFIRKFEERERERDFKRKQKLREKIKSSESKMGIEQFL